MSERVQMLDALDVDPAILFPRDTFGSAAYIGLSTCARVMLMEITTQAHMLPNGLLNVTHGTMGPGRVRPSLIAVAHELNESGLARWVRSGGTKRRPVTFWELPWLRQGPIVDEECDYE